MSMRNAILAALANGGQTRDELQSLTGESSTRVSGALKEARRDELVDMTKDDVTGMPLYSLTQAGKDRLKNVPEKAAETASSEPVDAPVKPTKATVTPKKAAQRYRNIDFNGGLVNDADFSDEDEARAAAGEYALRNQVGVDVCQVIATAQVELVPQLSWSSEA